MYMYMYIHVHVILSRPRRSGGTGRLLQKAISDIHSRRGQRKRGSERKHRDQENITGGILYIHVVWCVLVDYSPNCLCILNTL